MAIELLHRKPSPLTRMHWTKRALAFAYFSFLFYTFLFSGYLSKI